MKRLAVVAVLAAVAGCGDTINNTYVTGDGGSGNTNDAAGTCTPNAKECVTSRVARICAADGSGWVTQQCDFGDVCSGGDCTADPNVACVPGDGACVDATHALICNNSGMGYSTKTCPANTTCAGPGVCVGSCIVGESICLDANTVATCMDGQKLTTTSCTVGSTACVSTGTTPFQTAACKPAQCMPLPQGCDTVCGDKTQGAGNTDPAFESICTETPNGYKWVAIGCPAGGSCNPTGINCGNAQYAASCTTECSPGQTRCDGTGTAVQTCNAMGHWGATTSCTPDATGNQQVCIQNILGTDQARCGDAVCGFAPGACENDGFHPCVNGKVSSTATACTNGVCVEIDTAAASKGTPINGFIAGQCGTMCNNGDQRCVNNGNSVQNCVNGLWSTTLTACTTNSCQSFTDPSTGAPKALCGVCAPGSHRCTNSGGTPGTQTTHIETCNANGQAWGAAAACAVGRCYNAFNGPNNQGDDACISECVPGTSFCVGAAPASPTNTTHPGTVAVVTCTAAGILPDPPTCPAGTGCCPSGTSCRQGPSGKVVQSTNTPAACVECVGPSLGGNEAGLTDTRCQTATTLQTCQANNTWGTAATCTTTCTAEQGGIGVETCDSFNGTPISDSLFATFFGPGADCTIFGGAPSAPCGGVSDCCGDNCHAAPSPAQPGFCQ